VPRLEHRVKRPPPLALKKGGIPVFGSGGIDNLCLSGNIFGMIAKTMSVSLPGKLKAFIDARVRSGLYGNASDVICAGLRALTREEMGASITQFEKIMSALPQDPITPEIEQEIVEAVRKSRAAENRKAHK
jgi:putative addiction module CopG family antidote